MWLRNKLTEEIGWFFKQESEIRNLLVYIKKGDAWFGAFWPVEDTECVEGEIPLSAPFQ